MWVGVCVRGRARQAAQLASHEFKCFLLVVFMCQH